MRAPFPGFGRGYDETQLDEIGGRVALAILNENDRHGRLRERFVRDRAIDAVVIAAVRARHAIEEAA